MDQIDRKILAALQEDAGRPVADIAAAVGLSQSPCWRRIQKLEADGIIRGRVALLDAAALNLGVTAFVAVRTDRHDPEWLETFAQAVDDIPVLLGLHNQYRSKGFEIVGVSLDTQADSVAPFIKQSKIPWANIYEPGVFDSPLAQQYGILTAPTMFLVGRDGKVISTGISISDLKDGLRKQLD